MVINMPPRRSWGCRHSCSCQGGEFSIADVVFRADHPNKYDGDDGCGSMMVEDGKMKLISDISGQ